MLTDEKLAELRGRAALMRWHIVDSMGPNKPHHFGGSLSATDMVACLYFYKMRYNPADPKWPDRDLFVMSKGHSVPAQYVALAMLGVFPMEELRTLKKLGSRLQGHPDMRKTPGIEAPTGSLGMGLSFANGLALAARLDKRPSHAYVLVGDGELDEGQIWEAAMTTAHYGLDNVTVLIDRNTLQGMGRTEEAKRLEDIAAKWQAFGWHTLKIDGHDLTQICSALDQATEWTDKPTAIIARTVKGKGVSFIEDRFNFHNSALTPEQMSQAMSELTALVERETGIKGYGGGAR